jgi:hypothetical protein
MIDPTERALRDRARSWLYSEIGSHELCLERLGALPKYGVNEQQLASETGRMQEQLAIWRYLWSALEAYEGGRP